MSKTVILITNDDGVRSPGIKELQRALSVLGETYVVAPDRERSAAGHSLTIHRPLKVEEIASRVFSVSGTPTDCVAIGVEKVLSARPDLIVSGINNGPNLGDDITYSGTVSAAIEGTILSIPSIAVSLAKKDGEELHYATAAGVAVRISAYVLENSLPYDTLLNVNVPNVPADGLAGVRFTRQGKRIYKGAVKETFSPWGEKFFWIGGGKPYWEHGEDTDMNAVLEGYVSVTPIHLDLTNYAALDALKGWWERWNSNT
ncbi:MAG: 5'/3'-nucleotidase SurE [Thermodesulfovibrionales bacterium]